MRITKRHHPAVRNTVGMTTYCHFIGIKEGSLFIKQTPIFCYEYLIEL